MREDKGKSCRDSNIVAARAVADAVRTSLGPRGMDKMIQSGKGDVVITNDGATILKKMKLNHPCAKMVADLSAAQDVEAGDGTTSVVVITGALLGAAQRLLAKGLHPQRVTEAFLKAAEMANVIMKDMSIPIDLTQRGEILKAAKTSMCSKVVSQNSDVLGPIAVDSVLRVIQPQLDKDPASVTNVDLNDIRVSKKLGGTIEDSELVEGLVLTQNASRNAGGPTRVANAKIALIQFCLSPPKTDMESSVVIKDYAAMDRLLREERLHLAKMVKQIAKSGCNVLLIQKSILRDATTDLSLDFCAKAKIMVVRDIERDEVDFISRVLGVEPCAALDSLNESKLGHAELVAEENLGGNIGSLIRFSGLKATLDLTVPAEDTLTLACGGLELGEFEVPAAATEPEPETPQADTAVPNVPEQPDACPGVLAAQSDLQAQSAAAEVVDPPAVAGKGVAAKRVASEEPQAEAKRQRMSSPKSHTKSRQSHIFGGASAVSPKKQKPGPPGAKSRLLNGLAELGVASDKVTALVEQELPGNGRWH